MLAGLFAAIALAPLYWLAVPTRWRRDTLSGASLLALWCFDARLAPLLIALTLALAGALRVIVASAGARRRALGAAAGALLHRAIALDPGFAAAYGLAARCYTLRWANKWMVDVEAEATLRQV
jgi:hypothetical protein